MAEVEVMDEIEEKFDDVQEPADVPTQEPEVEKVTLKQRLDQFSEKHPKIVRVAKTVGVFAAGAAVTYIGSKVFKTVKKPKVDATPAIQENVQKLIETAPVVPLETVTDVVTDTIPDVVDTATNVIEVTAEATE